MLFSELQIGEVFYLAEQKYQKVTDYRCISLKRIRVDTFMDVVPERLVWSKTEEHGAFTAAYGCNTQGRIFLIISSYSVTIVNLTESDLGEPTLKSIAQTFGFNISFKQEEQNEIQ